MCRLRNIALRNFQESVTTGQTDTGKSDPYVPLCLNLHATQKVFKLFNVNPLKIPYYGQIFKILKIL